MNVQRAQETQLRPEDMVSTVFIFSDVEFDMATPLQRTIDIVYDAATRRFMYVEGSDCTNFQAAKVSNTKMQRFCKVMCCNSFIGQRMSDMHQPASFDSSFGCSEQDTAPRLSHQSSSCHAVRLHQEAVPCCAFSLPPGMQVAVALSLLTAAVARPPFDQIICTFSAQPQLHVVQGTPWSSRCAALHL